MFIKCRNETFSYFLSSLRTWSTFWVWVKIVGEAHEDDLCPTRISRGRTIGTPLLAIKYKPGLNIIFVCELNNITVSFLFFTKINREQKSTFFNLLYFVLFSTYFHSANFLKCNSNYANVKILAPQLKFVDFWSLKSNFSRAFVGKVWKWNKS